MSFNNFNGLIPSFSMAKNLTQIYLSSNYLTGQNTSTHWEELQHLVILDLSDNLLEGSIPVSLFTLPSLQTLLLSNNRFSGQLNEFNSSSSLLDTLDLSGNLLEGSIPVSLFSLPSLQTLLLSKNRFSGQLNEFNSSSSLFDTLDLSGNLLGASIPVSLFSLPSLQKLQLSNNRFSGQLNEFNSSSSLLDFLDLSGNSLEGPIPMSVFDLRGLKLLSLSSNKFNGSFPLHMIQRLENLINLDLSHNHNLLIEYHGTNSSLPVISYLASVNLKTFPDFLRNQSRLGFLDLSGNEIQGEIPNWIWKLQTLQYLNLSNNYLEGHILDLPSRMLALDLHSNQLQGQIPVLPFAIYLDLSRNNFNSYIPASIGDKLNATSFLFLSSNDLRGSIPESICKNASFLKILDLSNNSLSGEIPPCLIEMNLGVLNLSINNLSGTISDTFPISCGLQTFGGNGLKALDLSGNILEGVVPKSLANCTSLRLLNLGKNQIKDKFPCHLKNISSLRVLGLRENKFYGSIDCPGQNATWPVLQIVDLARNSFNGTLSIKYFKTWEAMMVDEHKMHQHEFSGLLGVFHQDAIPLTIKGQEMVFAKIPLTLITMIDVSSNNLQGPIPEEIGALNALVGLNLSHNAFTGQIPPSLGNLTELESLDLSRNNLNGKIPTQLANLNFLSVMNLSFNHLMGKIPPGTQLQSFPASSFDGNTGLCGAPLSKKCRDPTTPLPRTFEETHSNHGVSIAWKYISAELGFVFSFGIVIFPLMFWKRWRIWYYNHVDDVLFRIFPKLYLGKEYRGRRRKVFTNWRLRH